MQITTAGERFLEDLADELGTTVKPISGDEDYDLDLVCELTFSKAEVTQKQVKEMLGSELQAYAIAHSMQPPREKRRCWRLDYADGAQFHVDATPAIPDAEAQRKLLEIAKLDAGWSGTAIAITDNTLRQYGHVDPNWPASNPKGYSEWFVGRMGKVFQARRSAIALQEHAKVEDIPTHRVRTPLQSAIQILKRHRDTMFAKRPDDKPISIILTTLSAHAYEEEQTIAAALTSVLLKMDSFIIDRGGTKWVINPSDPRENFADKWREFPARERAFYEWLEIARADFGAAASASSYDGAMGALTTRLGQQFVETAAKRRKPGIVQGAKAAVGKVLRPAHRQEPPWELGRGGSVTIDEAISEVNGWRTASFSSDSEPLPKRANLRFHASTNVPKPYKVYWQVVNTGAEAAERGGLRGDFDEGEVSSGKLTRTESTSYKGTHSIECFIVKDRCLVARSGQFIVNVA
jgi:hypothetical protein